MIVDQIMTQKVVTVGMDDQLYVINAIFENTRFHHLLVIEDEKLVGVISDRDLLKALSPNLGTLSQTERDEATLKKRAHQIMTRSPIKVLKPGISVYDAIRLFNTHTISCIPIVDDKFRPVGIVSWRDIMKTIASTGIDDKTDQRN